MSDYYYPEEVTKDNIGNLLERARSIKQKSTISMFATSIIVAVVTIPSFYGFLFLGTYIANTYYSTSPIDALITVIAFLLLASEFLLFFLLEFVEFLINKALKLNYREVVFASCILLANSLYNNKKREAKREVNNFVTVLLGLKRTSGREYSKEINILSNGKKPLRRMILFSQNMLPELFLRFGSCVYYSDDAMAYLFMKSLIKEANHYGKLEGLFKQLENYVTGYKGLTTLVISIVGIVIALLGKGLITG